MRCSHTPERQRAVPTSWATVDAVSDASNENDAAADDPAAAAEVVAVSIKKVDVERLDSSAARRGVEREEVIAEAIDAFLAREMWSGGFIAPPPPMEVPGPFPWRGGAFRLRRRP